MQKHEEKGQNDRAFDEKVKPEAEKNRAKKDKTWDPDTSDASKKHNK